MKPHRSALQGANDWKEYRINPDYQCCPPPKPEGPLQIDTNLQKVLLQYGELTQVCYDSFYGDRSENTFGRNMFPPKILLQAAPVNKTSTRVGDYTAIRYLYANSGHECLIDNRQYKENRFWIGYVAVGPNIDGFRDIVFAWRGTVADSEWFEDIQYHLVPYDPTDPKATGPNVSRMAQGFHHMYTRSPEGQIPPQEQVREALDALWRGDYRELVAPDEIGSITVCGHSLGGALATVCAFHLGVAELGTHRDPEGAVQRAVPITAYTYSAPRVGDKAFSDALARAQVKVLRTVNFRDVVPKVPGISAEEREGVDVDDGTEWAGMFQHLGAFFKSFYQDIMVRDYVDLGTKVQFDSHDFQDIIITGPKHGGATRAHNLEILMHLIDPGRDIALMNKAQDALLPQIANPEDSTRYIPPYWNKKQPRKGIYLQADGTLRATRPYDESQESPADGPMLVSNTFSKANAM